MRRTQTVLILICLLMGLSSIVAVASPNFPSPIGFVNDFANIMDQQSKAAIEQIAITMQKEQGIEVAVVTIPTTEPLEPKEYAIKLFEQWGIGGPEDSGLLILVAWDEGRIEVEVGYGLEEPLPSGLVGAVLDQEVLGPFGEGEYGAGLLAGVQSFQKILAGEKYEIAAKKEGANWLFTFLVFLAIIVLFSSLNRRPPTNRTGSGTGTGGPRRTPPVVITTRTRFPSSGGGSSRGGFGGFGGGRSGGGGAGRSFR